MSRAQDVGTLALTSCYHARLWSVPTVLTPTCLLSASLCRQPACCLGNTSSTAARCRARTRGCSTLPVGKQLEQGEFHSLSQIQRGLCSSRCWPAEATLAEPPRGAGTPRGPHSKAWVQVAVEHVLGNGGAAQLARGVGVAAGEGQRGLSGLVCQSRPACGPCSWR